MDQVISEDDILLMQRQEKGSGFMYNKRLAYPAVNDGLQGVDSIKGNSYGLIKHHHQGTKWESQGNRKVRGERGEFDCPLAESDCVEPIKIMRCFVVCRSKG